MNCRVFEFLKGPGLDFVRITVPLMDRKVSWESFIIECFKHLTGAEVPVQLFLSILLTVVIGRGLGVVGK